MTLKNLRTKVRKAFGFSAKVSFAILMVMNDRTLVPLEEDRDCHDLSWIGLETDSQLVCSIL